MKVKLKNLDNLLKAQTWVDIEGLSNVAICEFSYKAKFWQHPRMLKAMRSVKEYVEISYLGEIKTVPVYQYVCYASRYDMDAVEYGYFLAFSAIEHLTTVFSPVVVYDWIPVGNKRAILV